MKIQFILFPLILMVSCKNEKPGKQHLGNVPDMEPMHENSSSIKAEAVAKKASAPALVRFEVFDFNSSTNATIAYRWAHINSSGNSNGENPAGSILEIDIIDNDIISFSNSNKIEIKIKILASTIYPETIKIYLKNTSPSPPNTCNSTTKQQMDGIFIVESSSGIVQNNNSQRSYEFDNIDSNFGYIKCFTHTNGLMEIKYIDEGRGEFVIKLESPTNSDTKIDVVMDDSKGTPTPSAPGKKRQK